MQSHFAMGGKYHKHTKELYHSSGSHQVLTYRPMCDPGNSLQAPWKTTWHRDILSLNILVLPFVSPHQ
jgi:hypothetical protein